MDMYLPICENGNAFRASIDGSGDEMTIAAAGLQIKIGNPLVGDMIDPIDLPMSSGEIFKTSDFVGKPSVVIFYPSEQLPSCIELLRGFRDAQSQFKSRNAFIVAVSLSPSDVQKTFAQENQFSFPILSDAKLLASSQYGVLRPRTNQPADRIELSAAVRVVLIAPDLRIAKIYDKPPSATAAAQVLADMDALFFKEPPRHLHMHAPVLVISDAMPLDLCQRLIQTWHDRGNIDSGFMKQIDGKTIGLTDYSHKIRRDHFMQAGADLDTVKKFISARVLSKIRTAFNYEVTRFEDFRIANYDASRGGYFRPHRDNTTDGTAHRRFAMSLMLNDEYQGGMLRFPEYGLHEYRPPVGGAVVFSCSLLHEATDVTAGQRFVLLTFFYGEKEAKIREEYARRTGAGYKA
jgi:peroxiredoxin